MVIYKNIYATSLFIYLHIYVIMWIIFGIYIYICTSKYNPKFLKQCNGHISYYIILIFNHDNLCFIEK